MKVLRLLTIAALAALVSMTTVSCGDDQYSIPEPTPTTPDDPNKDSGTDTDNAAPGETDDEKKDNINSGSDDEGWHREDINPGNSPYRLWGIWNVETDSIKDLENDTIPVKIKYDDVIPQEMKWYNNQTVEIAAVKEGELRPSYTWVSWHGHYVYNKDNNWFGVRLTCDNGLTEYCYIGSWVLTDETHAVWTYQIYEYTEQNLDVEANGGTGYHVLYFKKQ